MGRIYPVLCCLGITPDRGITGRLAMGTELVKSLGLDDKRKPRVKFKG